MFELLRLASIRSLGNFIDCVRVSAECATFDHPCLRMPRNIGVQKVYPRHASRNVSTSTTLVDIRLLANGALHRSMSMLAKSHAGMFAAGAGDIAPAAD